MAPIFPDNWEALSPDDLARARSALAGLVERSTPGSGTRKQLRALVTPLEATQDAIILMEDVFRS
jgi:hypothetical protein